MVHLKIALLAIRLCLSGSIYTSHNNGCSYYEVEKAEKRTSFGVSEGWQPNVIVRVYVAGDRCDVNVTEIYASVQDLKNMAVFAGDTFYLELAFTSSEFTEIYFNTESVNTAAKQEYIVHLQVFEVKLSTDNLNNFARVAKIFSLAVADTSLISTRADIDCTFLNDTVSLSISPSVQDFHFNNSLIKICSGHFTKVFSLTFSDVDENMTNFLPSAFTVKLPDEFPGLQQLVFENVDVEGNITFPWSDNYSALNPYSLDQTIPVLRNENRRWFQIIKKESSTYPFPQVELKGKINTVVLNNINRNIPIDMLHNITDLEKLDMARNNIEFLFNDMLVHQHGLIELTLKENYMFGIEGNAFADLGELKFLDLSKNGLLFLPRHIFDNLTKLEEVHLEHNQISAIESNFVQNLLRTLKIVILHSNPLLDIPLLPLYALNLRLLDLHNTSLDGRSISVLINRLDNPLQNIGSYLNYHYHGSPFITSDITTKVIDMSNSDIATIQISSMHEGLILQRLLKTVKINFEGNPFYCACGILNLQTILNMLLQTHPSESKFSAIDMICQEPQSLRGRSLLSISHDEMYCPITDQKKCPTSCFCSRRSFVETYIIDCSHTNISSFPMSLSFEGNIELWFHNASIEEMEPRNYFVNVTVLDLSNNKIKFVDPNASAQFENLHTLKLASNLLATLPIEIKNNTHLSTLTLSDNPWLCDCKLKWMKSWLIEIRPHVQDFTHIRCTDGSNKGMEFVNVEESKFTCNVVNSVRIKYNSTVVISSVVAGFVLVALTVSILLIYFQRLSIKALLYVYCGFHPFDNDSEDSATGVFDAVTIYCYDDYEFMHDCVMKYLDENGYGVVDMYRDFIIGVSFTENVKYFIGKSRRMIICLSAHSADDELMKVAWSVAYEKVLDSCSNFIILIRDRLDLKEIKDKTLLRYFRNKRYIAKTSPILQKCLRYLMPKPRDDNRATRQKRTMFPKRNPSAFICYPDNLHKFVTREILPCLKNRGHEVRIFELEFVPGGAIGEEIVDAIENSERLIFVLSKENIDDDMKMLILKTAIVRTLTCDYNFLLLFTHGTVHVEDMPSDVRNYVNTHATASIEDHEFMNRLCSALEFCDRVSENTVAAVDV